VFDRPERRRASQTGRRTGLVDHEARKLSDRCLASAEPAEFSTPAERQSSVWVVVARFGVVDDFRLFGMFTGLASGRAPRSPLAPEPEVVGLAVPDGLSMRPSAPLLETSGRALPLFVVAPEARPAPVS